MFLIEHHKDNEKTITTSYLRLKFDCKVRIYLMM